MKKLSVVVLVLALVLGWGLSVACAGPYVSGNVGAVWLEDSDISGSDGADRLDAELTFDAGFGVTAAIGNAYDNGLRAEVEFGYRTSDTDKLKGSVTYDSETYSGSGSVDGELSAMSLMANVYYDFMPKETISPFIGAGIGYANVEADIDDLGDEDDGVFAYQVAAGVAFAVNKETKIDLQYRYFATDDPKFDGIDGEYASHNAMVGVRYSF